MSGDVAAGIWIAMLALIGAAAWPVPIWVMLR
jgi:hypothetical protein